MKLLAVILSILTITLSSIPCDDELIVSGELVFELQNSENHLGDFGDMCSPFCSCVCCTTITIEPNTQQNISYKEIPSNKLNTYSNSIYSNNFLDKILQPPRV
ncbi:MAG: hypothetical protein L3J14_00475 [Flavobacteriaceae bacterium]|nr:hypothetical protein [Flavobacteriaceae bacterium]